jgi:hypothetical protein
VSAHERPASDVGGVEWYRSLDWSQTSFTDVTDAAVHYALVEFGLAIEERTREDGHGSNLSDIYAEWRATIQHITRGQIDAAEWLAAREAGG